MSRLFTFCGWLGCWCNIEDILEVEDELPITFYCGLTYGAIFLTWLFIALSAPPMPVVLTGGLLAVAKT